MKGKKKLERKRQNFGQSTKEIWGNKGLA